MAMAPGMPNIKIRKNANHPTLATTELSQWHASRLPSVNRRPAPAPAAAKASHLTCCRSSASPRRYRTTSPMMQPATASDVTHATPTRVVEISPRRLWMPKGFWNVMPLSGSSRPGFTTSRRKPTAAPAIAVHSTGRHRGDGSDPVGNSNTMAASETIVGTQSTWVTAATSLGAGRDPGEVSRPTATYVVPKATNANASPANIRIHPIAFRARSVMRSPIVA